MVRRAEMETAKEILTENLEIYGFHDVAVEFKSKFALNCRMIDVIRHMNLKWYVFSFSKSLSVDPFHDVLHGLF